MAKKTSENIVGNLSTYSSLGDYDSTKMYLPQTMKQYNGSTNANKYVGPINITIGRPVESGGAFSGIYPHVIDWSPTISWIFLADNAAVAATRRVQMWIYNKTEDTLSYGGFCTFAFPSAGTQGTYTVRALRMTYDTYTTGTASVSGTAVTGTSTTWSADRIPVGCRIGFGSTVPSEITTWYEINAVGSDTGITLTGSAGNISDGPYVIEDLRCIQAVTNAVTATNGGLFMAKGLRFENFNTTGLTIPAAVTTDGVRANYWLKDAATNTNTVSLGVGITSKDSWTQQDIYVLNTVANQVVYKYNIRANLAGGGGLSGGGSVEAFVLVSGSGGAVTGAPTQNNNARLAITNHGPGSGVPCLYWTTATRVYRSVDVTTITSGMTNWIADAMVEIPPGTTTTFAALATFQSIEYAPLMDAFIIPTTSRVYVTKYKTDSSQLDRICTVAGRQLYQVTASTDTTPYPSNDQGVFSVWADGGIVYLVSTGTTAVTNIIWAIPFSADGGYSNYSEQYVIFPKLSTVGATALYRSYMSHDQVVGSDTGYSLGIPTEPITLYYRTNGIDNNTGTWTALDSSGSLVGVAPTDEIQFKAEYRVIGQHCVPGRIHSISVVYEDETGDEHYHASGKWTDYTTNTWAWRFVEEFGTTVPRLKISLYNDVTGTLLYVDDSTTQSGTWEKSTDDGNNWSAYDTDDKVNETTYIRFVPDTLASGLKVLAVLSQY
jgi:hypothetical protein